MIDDANKKPTQATRLLRHLLLGRKINPLSSWRSLGIYRLASRIHELRAGKHDECEWPILDKWTPVKNQFGEEVKVKEYYMRICHHCHGVITRIKWFFDVPQCNNCLTPLSKDNRRGMKS